MLEPHHILAIYSSPYRRAMETVQPLAERLRIPIQIEPDLRERQLTIGRVERFEEHVAAAWQNFDWSLPGGESSRVAQRRVSGVVHRLADAAGGRPIVLSTHGNALALFLHVLDPAIDFAFWSRMTMPDIYGVERNADGAWSYDRVWPF